VTGIGSAIFAFLAAGAFRTIEEAQAKVCPQHAVFTPQPEARQAYDELYSLFRRIISTSASRRGHRLQRCAADLDPGRAGIGQHTMRDSRQLVEEFRVLLAANRGSTARRGGSPDW